MYTRDEWTWTAVTVHLFFVNHVFCLSYFSTEENYYFRLSNKYFTTWYINNTVSLPVEPVYSVVIRTYKNNAECNNTRLSYYVSFAPKLVPCATHFLSVLIQLYWDRSMNVLSREPESIFRRSLTQNFIGHFQNLMCIGLISDAHLFTSKCTYMRVSYIRCCTY